MSIKTITKSKQYRRITLPVSLLEDLNELGLTRIGLHKCLLVIYRLGVDPSVDKRNNFYEFHPMPKTYLMKMFGRHYDTTINALKAADIIQCDDIFYEGRALRYRLNPIYIHDKELVTTTFSYTAKERLEDYTTNRSYLETFKDDFNTLTIPFEKLYDIIDRKVKDISLHGFKIGEANKWEGERKVQFWEKVNGEVVTKRQTIDYTTAMLICLEDDIDIINDGKMTYLADLDDFIEEKKTNIRQSWTTAVDNLRDEKTLYAKRNKTNDRLDTNFTNLSSELYDVILEYNGLIEIDARNSQPALLGMKMEQEGIVEQHYLDAAYEGELYDELGKAFDMNRAEAKQTTFEVLFSGYKCNTEAKKRFKKLYPVTWDYTVALKKEKGNNAVAIELQRLEASIFIDRLYDPLVASGVLCFTKHDSVVCREEDYDMVMGAVREVFEEIGYKGKTNQDN